jgi:ABC-type branched-subunit amino acid transport system ATPase component
VTVEHGQGRAADLAGSGPPLLAVEELTVAYGAVIAVRDVSLQVAPGEIVAALGPNGAGKTTLLRTLAGALKPQHGSIVFDGGPLNGLVPEVVVRRGVVLVPEGRHVFPGLTVEENLTVLLRDPALRQQAYDRFPILAQRRKQVAGLLSGGEQQMLSLAPALADPPKVLIADEPTLGLAPLAAEAVMQAIIELRDAGTAVLLVEEHAQNALKVADTLAFMELGKIVWRGPRADADMELLATAYLGSETR